MGLISLASAARRRVDQVRAEGDGGFMMIYVLTITAVIAIVVGGTLVVTTSAIVPSVKSSYDQAADAAAQSGLQAFIAQVDADCATATSVSDCATHLDQASGTTSIPVPGSTDGYSATYSWVATPDTSNPARYFRVKSVGKVSQGGVSATKTVIGDVVGGASVDDLDYGVITGFESLSSSTVLAQWQARTIALDAGAIDAADVPVKGSTIRWSGASPGSAAGKVAVCNATFDEKGGRANLPAPKAPNPYVDWTESGLAGNNYTNFQPCQTSWGAKTKLLASANPNDGPGGYFSNDAMLLSNSYPGGSGPLFNQPVSTLWHYTSADAGICSTAPGQNYRSFNLQCAGYPIEVGGAPATASTYPTVTAVSQGPQLPNTTPIIPSDACVYAGPTRVRMSGDSATVTSPQTTLSWIAANASARPLQCYTGATASGMAAQTVNLTSPTQIQVLSVNNNGAVPKTTPAIAHGSSGWPQTNQKLGSTPSTSNSVFYMTAAGTSAADADNATAADTCSSSSTYTGSTASTNCQWSNASNTTAGSSWTTDGPGWTKFSAGTTCTTAPTDKLTFECDYNNGAYGTGRYGVYRAAVKSALASASVPVAAGSGPVTIGTTTSATCTGQTITPTSASSTQLRCMLQDLLHQANTGGKQPGWTNPSAGDRQYVVTAGTTTTTPTTVTLPSQSGAADDPFFSRTVGTPATETLTTKTTPFTVARQVYGCYVPTSPTIGTILRSVLSTLGLTANPGAYDATGQLCGQLCTLALLCATGPGVQSWGDGGASSSSITQAASQFQTTVTQKTYSNFTQGTTVTSFPAMADVTQYELGNSGTFGASGPGDLYVEGDTSHTVALVAADDLIVTGPTGPTGTNPANPSATNPNPETNGATPTTALELIGQNSVRVYHPVKCAVTDSSMISTTDPGWCPDDITGLYSSVLPAANRPDQQYVNLRPDLAGLTIHAAVFALGNADAHITCPQPPSGDGVCGGEFTVDNYNRGSSLGYLTEIGTLAMAHHSPVGQEWEVADSSGQSSRPYSGYQLAQQYQNIKAAINAASEVKGTQHTTSSSSSLWHIMSISSGGGS